jgi:hypothetical protein
MIKPQNGKSRGKKRNVSIQKISKIEAAQRQLDTAIGLWFEGGDAVSITALNCAASQVLYNLAGKLKKKVAGMFDRAGMDMTQAAHFYKFMGDICGFFKHADRKNAENAVLEMGEGFEENYLPLFLLNTSQQYRLLGHALTDPMAAVFAWCVLHHPAGFEKDFVKSRKFNGVDRTTLRISFLEAFKRG